MPQLVTDPPVSEPQRRAMFAAREGRSTLGIPKKVGEEFVGKADQASFERVRSAVSEKADNPEALAAWIKDRIDPGWRSDSASAFKARDQIWDPPPPPLRIDLPRMASRDQASGDFLAQLRNFLRGLLNWAGEEEAEPHHEGGGAGDQPLLPNSGIPPGLRRRSDDCDAFGLKPVLAGRANAHDMMFALDRDTVRSKDVDGRLHVDESNISKATVNPYRGEEIPDWRELGLKPDQTYMLLRHPDELAKAAPSFNNLPILSEHVPVSADSADAHHPELVIGSTGTDANWDGKYLKNSLVFWARPAIDVIESGDQEQLSAAYRYRADMTPGTFEGQRFDGIMRDIEGNHVALVRKGRAGPDVVVGDSEEGNMKFIKSAVVARLIAAKKKGRLATDADPADIAEILPPLLEALGGGVEADQGVLPPAVATRDVEPPPVDPSHAEQEQNIREADFDDRLVKDRAITRARDAARRLGRDESEEERKKREEDDQAADAEWQKAQDQRMGLLPHIKRGDEAGTPQPDLVTKKAMDSEITKRVTLAVAGERTRQQKKQEAERFVRPWVGDLPTAIAMDSDEDVYRTALGMLEVKTDGIHPSAYRTILEMRPKPSQARDEALLQRFEPDLASDESFAKRFPGIPTSIPTV